MSFKTFFDEEYKEDEKIEDEFDPKEVELGLKEEAEHKDLYDIFKKCADENKIEMPLTEEEFFLKIVEAHLRENPKYYSEFKECQTHEDSETPEEEIKEAQEISQRDMNEFGRRVHEIESAPLADRKEAQAEWFKDMRENPSIVKERIEWLIDGNYGNAEQYKAVQILKAPRMNRIAALAIMIAQLEWQCPQRMSIDAWKKLTPQEQSTVNGKIEEAIKEWEAEQTVEEATSPAAIAMVKKWKSGKKSNKK